MAPSFDKPEFCWTIQEAEPVEIVAAKHDPAKAGISTNLRNAFMFNSSPPK
jgi:hypothetical protein